MAGTVPTAVFVYGTLMPGHLRWGLLAPHATSHSPAAAAGRLYDTGHGWPAAVLGDAAGAVVPGHVVMIARGVLDRVLAELDVVEDVELGLYERVRVRPEGNTAEAWAWSYLRPVDGLERIDRWDGRPER